MRLGQGGLIDRGAALDFTFDGRACRGLKGDTLASALLANGVRLMGRSFKYHRPRGVVSARSDEPNALMTVAGAPNTRATVQELYAGLEARSQNAWPSLGFDLMAVTDRFSRFLGAGFYYKTFMWPKSFWEAVYEPLIRRAAGLGALPPDPERAPYEKAFAFCDLLVILADEDSRFGGRLLAEREEVGGRPGADWAAHVIEELAALPNVRLMPRTTVTGAYDGGTYGALERVARHVSMPGDAPRDCFWRIVAPRAVLAAGATERGIAFADNDRPGVMQASAVREYVNRYAVAPGRRVAVFGSGADSLRTVRDLRAAGVEVAALIEAREGVTSEALTFAGTHVIGTRGRQALSEVLIRDGATTRGLQADCLAVAGGWNPAVHLTCHLGARPVWREEIAGFVPAPGAVPGMIAAGACAGSYATAACLREGAMAAAEALDVAPVEIPDAEDGPHAAVPLWEVPGVKGRAWLDLQNDVTTKDVRQSAQEGFRSVEHMKRYTTQGMATDQGKGSNVSALAVLADATGRGIPGTGTTTFRPPYTPVPIAAMGAGGLDQGFAPTRLTTSDAASRARGAPMVEAGLWYRPSYFPQPGETTWREACDREVQMVRAAVGVTDVSTLGKIDLQGPDAAAFLDFVYANTMSTLAEGRVRYGLMLREDGFVMDDGTCARLGAQHYLVTTTTAAAGQVMAHLDWVAQGLRPDWDVQISSVTEHWAQFAVAGPLAAELLPLVMDEVPPLPFMGWAEARVMGAPGRLFRISFSGELGYEIAVPARYGDSLFRVLAAQAEALGGGAYGMEALNVLRLEKGFLTHAEIDGRVTAEDLGLGRMISAKKDCVGKTMAGRPGLQGPERPQLVGVTAREELLGGAHLVAVGGSASEGHLSSVGYSPTTQQWVGLGLLVNGRARHGETLRMVDHMRGAELRCEVCDPVMVDPEGGRMRG